MKTAGTLIFLFIAGMLAAQTDKGKYLIGGNADLSEALLNTTSTFNLALSPSFGVFAAKNFAIGGIYSFGVNSVRSRNSNGSYTTSTVFQPLVGPFLKYYIGKKQLKGVVSVNAGYTVYTRLRSTSNSNSGTSITNYDGFAVGWLAGMAYFFNPHVSLETGLYLNAAGYKGYLPTSRFGFSLGLYVFLDKKKQE